MRLHVKAFLFVPTVHAAPLRLHCEVSCQCALQARHPGARLFGATGGALSYRAGHCEASGELAAVPRALEPRAWKGIETHGVMGRGKASPRLLGVAVSRSFQAGARSAQVVDRFRLLFFFSNIYIYIYCK